MAQERMANNFVYAFHKKQPSKWSWIVEVRSCAEGMQATSPFSVKMRAPSTGGGGRAAKDNPSDRVMHRDISVCACVCVSDFDVGGVGVCVVVVWGAWLGLADSGHHPLHPLGSADRHSLPRAQVGHLAPLVCVCVCVPMIWLCANRVNSEKDILERIVYNFDDRVRKARQRGQATHTHTHTHCDACFLTGNARLAEALGRPRKRL